VAHRVGRGIALLFHDCGTRSGLVVSSTPRPHFTAGRDPVPILQKARWATGPVWTGGKSGPHLDSIPDRPARSQSLYRLSYRAHNYCCCRQAICITYSEFRSVVLVIQREKCMRRILLSSVACLAAQYFSELSHKRRDHRRKFTEHKRCVSIFSRMHSICLTHLILLGLITRML